jgi:hypothetical protein
MAPSAVDVDVPIVTKGAVREPLKLSGALDQYESFDVTPVIGREFPTAKLVEWLEAPNSDELLRDLAITSQSCVSMLPASGPADSTKSRSAVWYFSVPRTA